MSLRPRGYRHRIVAAAASVAATLGLMGGMSMQSRPWVAAPTKRDAIEVRLLAWPRPVRTPSPTPPMRPRLELPGEPARRGSADRASASRPAPQALPITAAAVEPSLANDAAGAVSLSPETAPAQAVLPAASAPLKLDATTLRAAAGQSKGPVQRLAEASGQDLGRSATSPTQRLGTAVQNAAKPDCVTVGSASGLFAVPVIAYAVIKDACR